MEGYAQGGARVGLVAIALAFVTMGSVTTEATNPPSMDPAMSSMGAAASGDPGAAGHLRDVSILMAAPMATFQRHKDAQEPAGLDWSDDGCSAAGPLRYSSMFLDACERHDFGYRNYGSRLRLSPLEATRAAVDRRLREDMDQICADSYAGDDLRLRACAAASYAAYSLVRVFGGPSFYGQATCPAR
jgi:hypothetical protein